MSVSSRVLGALALASSFGRAAVFDLPVIIENGYVSDARTKHRS